MSQKSLKAGMAKAVTELSAAGQPKSQWLVGLSTQKPVKRNHFVLFLKPELLNIRGGARLNPILDLIGAALEKFGVETGAVRALNGPYLARYKIMEQHYGVINRTSRLGLGALSPPTRQKLESECPGIKSIFGAHQFLARYPDVSAFAVNIIVDTLGSKRVASGKYYSVLNVEGEKVIVLNAFHPQQLLHYTDRGQTVVAFECFTDTDWNVLRHELTGTTDPSRAPVGSIRRTLRDRSDELGLIEVATGTNGVHCSAGPLEGMLEFCRFFSDHADKKLISPGDTPFGRLLQKEGLRKKDIAMLAKNPILGEGTDAVSAFNQTEDKNSEAAAELLVSAMRQAVG